MRQNQTEAADAEMLDEYDFSGGIRGKYANRFAQGSNIVALDPDVARVFPDAEAVNAALRDLIRIAGRATTTKTAGD